MIDMENTGKIIVKPKKGNLFNFFLEAERLGLTGDAAGHFVADKFKAAGLDLTFIPPGIPENVAPHVR